MGDLESLSWPGKEGRAWSQRSLAGPSTSVPLESPFVSSPGAGFFLRAALNNVDLFSKGGNNVIHQGIMLFIEE